MKEKTFKDLGLDDGEKNMKKLLDKFDLDLDEIMNEKKELNNDKN